MKVTVGDVTNSKCNVRDYLSYDEDTGRIYVEGEAIDTVLIDKSEEWDKLQSTIDDLSMAHDNLQRELADIKQHIGKDKHVLIKRNIALNKRVQELEDTIYRDERQAVLEGLYEQNKRYRERIEYMLEEAKDHKRKGLRIQHWALIKDLEEALEELE